MLGFIFYDILFIKSYRYLYILPKYEKDKLIERRPFFDYGFRQGLVSTVISAVVDFISCFILHLSKYILKQSNTFNICTIINAGLELSNKTLDLLNMLSLKTLRPKGRN